MKRFGIPAIAASLLLATSALAAQNGRPILLAADEHRDADRPEEHHTTAAPREEEHRSTEHATAHHRARHVHRTHATSGTEEHRDTTTTRSRDTETNREHTTTTTGEHARNIDKTTYQRNVTATHRFHAGTYRQPQGYYYRRWTFGDVLPRLFWSQDYWLNDYGTYGLIAPPDGYVWVRYGDDALLIDTDTGEILQVDYGVFY